MGERKKGRKMKRVERKRKTEREGEKERGTQ